MTIVPFLKDNVFGPQDIQAMSTAFEEVCNILNMADHAKSERELLAKKIIALAPRDKCHAAFLRDRLLREIAGGQGGWPGARSRRSSRSAFEAGTIKQSRARR